MSSAADLRRPTFPAWSAGNGLVATSGVAALDPETLRPLCDDFAGQAAWVLDRLDVVLDEAGSSRDGVLRVECFLADRSWFGAWDEAFAGHFGECPPSRTTLICGLPVDGLLIELQAIAVIAVEPDLPTPRM
ncbi:MAG TPA: RidA family protein [Solirubrobacteraceae bacterium]|jgi:2-iminobutanoate/2-iminopropanoate deaminase|nr:RidA family protein [Solirubrobacteraceae bacterium]